MINLQLIPPSTVGSALAAATGAAQGGTALNAQPAAAVAIAPSPPAVAFPSISKPTIDLGAIRSEIRTTLTTIDVDLSVARSIALSNMLVLAIQGTEFIIDRAGFVGNATLHFNDGSNKPVSSIFVQPGDNASIPFSYVAIENLAQPGFLLRIHYGTEVLYKPGAPGTVLASVLASLSTGNLQGIDNVPAIGKAFWGAATIGAVAAQSPYVQIFNPVGSIITLFLDAIWVQDSTAAADIALLSDTAQLGGGVSGFSKNPSTGASASKLGVTNLAADPGTSTIMVPRYTQLNVTPAYVRVPISPPALINPGRGFDVVGRTLNSALSAGFEWREL